MNPLSIVASDVNEAYSLGLFHMTQGQYDLVDTRNGKARRLPGPVTTVYQQPQNCVLFDEMRDANPYFHLIEAIWMLGGHNNVSSLVPFNPRMKEYSDDGHTLHGAYGFRWRYHFGFDQIEEAIKTLRSDRTSRRVVIQMFDPHTDVPPMYSGKDVPCNLCIDFKPRNGNILDMMVHCRSNDMIWGAYGANAVHFSFLMQYMCWATDMRMGLYYQISDDFHAYEDVLRKISPLEAMLYRSPYRDPNNGIESYHIGTDAMDNPKSFRRDCSNLFDYLVNHDDLNLSSVETNYFRQLMIPIVNSHRNYREWKKTREPEFMESAKTWLGIAPLCDWTVACWQWLDRREANYNRAKDDGVRHD